MQNKNYYCNLCGIRIYTDVLFCEWCEPKVPEEDRETCCECGTVRLYIDMNWCSYCNKRYCRSTHYCEEQHWLEDNHMNWLVDGRPSHPPQPVPHV